MPFTAADIKRDFDDIVADPFVGEQIVYEYRGKSVTCMAVVERNPDRERPTGSARTAPMVSRIRDARVRVSRTDIPTPSEREGKIWMPVQIGGESVRWSITENVPINHPGMWLLELARG